MRLGFLTHIMVLNYCTLQIPNSWILSSWEGCFLFFFWFRFVSLLFFSNCSNCGLQYRGVIRAPVLFPSAIKWSLTACLLNADYCISLTATILGLNWKWPCWALYRFHTFFFPSPAPPSPLPPFCRGFVLKDFLCTCAGVLKTPCTKLYTHKHGGFIIKKKKKKFPQCTGPGMWTSEQHAPPLRGSKQEQFAGMCPTEELIMAQHIRANKQIRTNCNSTGFK